VIKLIKRILLAIFAIMIIFLTLALTSGGDSFRWFGDTVRDVSHDLGEVADLLDQATEDIKSASHTIKKTGTRIKDIAEETGEKASNIANTTTEMVGDIKNAVSAVSPEAEDEPEKKPKKRVATKGDKDKGTE
jgi:methyl-accepting chemotaxis protein